MIVTISRQAASRGEQVAQRVAQRLAVPLVDPETVQRAATRIDLPRENLADPQRAARVGERLAQLVLILADEPVDDADWVLAPVPTVNESPGYRLAIETMLRALGEASGVVIVGFASQVVLAKAPNTIHSLVISPLALRVQRLVAREDLNFPTAERVLRDADRERSGFYRRHYNVTWDDPLLYDCILNTARLGVEQSASVIVSAVQRRNLMSP